MTDAVRDPLTGRVVRSVANRQGRPNQPTSGCAFCPGGLEAPEHYDTHWFENRWPPLPDGRAEVLLYSPDHDASMATLTRSQARAVVDLWAARTAALGARDDVSYVLPFENRGAEVGATMAHPHGQLYAYDFIPPAAQSELGSRSCAFCVTSPAELVVCETDGWTAFVPAHAAWPYELVLQPNAHIADLPALGEAERDALAELLPTVVRTLDRHFGAAAPLMLWIHQRPTDGGDWPGAHLHLHITPIWRATGVQRFVAAAELGSDVFFNPVEPSDAAADLRAAL